MNIKIKIWARERNNERKKWMSERKKKRMKERRKKNEQKRKRKTFLQVRMQSMSYEERNEGNKNKCSWKKEWKELNGEESMKKANLKF